MYEKSATEVICSVRPQILLYRAKNGGDLSLKHKRFLGSPTATDSRNDSQAGHHEASPTNTVSRVTRFVEFSASESSFSKQA
jgi:hypothetical protein